MFELVNLPEEEDFIRDALIGNVLKLSKVSAIKRFKDIIGCLRDACCLEGNGEFPRTKESFYIRWGVWSVYWSCQKH